MTTHLQLQAGIRFILLCKCVHRCVILICNPAFCYRWLLLSFMTMHLQLQAGIRFLLPCTVPQYTGWLLLSFMTMHLHLQAEIRFLLPCTVPRYTGCEVRIFGHQPCITWATSSYFHCQLKLCHPLG